MKYIDSFTGDYEFLDMAYESEIRYGAHTFNNALSAYFAQSVNDEEIKSELTNASGPKAYAIIKDEERSFEWDSRKSTFMYEILWNKFTRNPELGDALIATGGMFLIDRRDGDGSKLWNVVNGAGNNLHGFMLMHIRERLASIKGYNSDKYSDAKDSMYYPVLSNFNVNITNTMHLYKRSIIDKFTAYYGSDELVFVVLDSIIGDAGMYGDDTWEEECRYYMDCYYPSPSEEDIPF